MNKANTDRCFETHGGKMLDYVNPQPDQISLGDIAHGLSNTCRFLGHTSVFYSVAEHAILVADLYLKRWPGSWEYALVALHHDDHEAYTGDMPTPLKVLLGGTIEAVSDRIDTAIVRALDLPCRASGFQRPAVKWADRVAMRMEAYKMKSSGGYSEHWAPAWEGVDMDFPFLSTVNWSPGLSPAEAERAFLDAHAQLVDALGARPDGAD